MGIAEQMGRTLQRTSISVNIKERLDFSCALFGPDGSLVANAPHLPVHLGAMSEANRFQVLLFFQHLYGLEDYFVLSADSEALSEANRFQVLPFLQHMHVWKTMLSCLRL